MYDTGRKFSGFDFQELLHMESCKSPILLRILNFIERIHLTIGNHLREIKFMQKEEWYAEFYAILQFIALAVRTTIHTVTSYSPAQLIFSKDMIMQMHINVNW